MVFPMSRTPLACRCLIVSLFLLSGIGHAAEKPNIVFFFIDDLGWKDLGFMGSDFYETPHIDRLASTGTVFMNAYACAPNCAPSRACLLSGQYTPRHGVYTVGSSERGAAKDRQLVPIENTAVLADEFVTVAEALQAHGYVTATMGKWHLGKDPTTQGFNVNIAGKQWGSPSGGGYHSPYKYPNLVNDEPGEYLTDRLAVEACKFIETNRDQPFFLYLTHYAVHTPIQGKPELIKKYQAKNPGKLHRNAAYAAMVESTDDSVGTVLNKLEQLGLTKKTLVIFFSDNGGYGPATSMAPLRGSKGMLYEGGIREPLIVKWPGVTRPGSICRENVIGVDVYPTLLDISGTEPPANYNLDGVSLTPLLRDPDAALNRDAIYWHFPCYLQPYSKSQGLWRTTPAGAIRRGDWKLIEFFEDGQLELYNIAQDIGETRNLSQSRPDKVQELHAAMLAWRERVQAPVPTKRNPKYVDR